MMKFFGLNSKIKKSSVLLVLLVISLGINLFFLVAWAKKLRKYHLQGHFLPETRILSMVKYILQSHQMVNIPYTSNSNYWRMVIVS